MPSSVCAQCGRPVDSHNRHVRFRLPEPVHSMEHQERAPGVWMSHDDPNESVMMQVPNVGPFVRCLLPVHLTGGYTVTFGVWLAVHPDDLQRAFKTWWEPEYRDLALDGYLANKLPLWGLLASPARAEVRDENETPYIVQSSETELARVLTTQWPHEMVLASLPA